MNEKIYKAWCEFSGNADGQNEKEAFLIATNRKFTWNDPDPEWVQKRKAFAAGYEAGYEAGIKESENKNE